MDTKNQYKFLSKKIDYPTQKQLERSISHQFHVLYRQEMGFSPQEVVCKLFKNYLILVVEEAVSPLELTISKSGHTEILREIRQSINRVMRSELEKLVKETAAVEIIDLVCDLNIDSHRLMAIALLSEPPVVRVKKRQSKK